MRAEAPPEAFVRWVSLAGVVLRPDDHRRPLEDLNGSSQASTRSVRHHPSRVGIKCSDIPAAWRACTAPSVRQPVPSLADPAFDRPEPQQAHAEGERGRAERDGDGCADAGEPADEGDRAQVVLGGIAEGVEAVPAGGADVLSRRDGRVMQTWRW
jgi:hypothetical protein